MTGSLKIVLSIFFYLQTNPQHGTLSDLTRLKVHVYKTNVI